MSRNRPPKMPTLDKNFGKEAVQPQVKIDLSQMPNFFCGCGNPAFQPIVLFKKLSALMSPTGKEGLVPIETFQCTGCGRIPKEMLPVPITKADPAMESSVSDIISTDLR